MWCSSLGPAHWFPSTVLGDAVPRRALLWLTSLSLPVWWQLCVPLCRSQRLSLSLLYTHGHNCKGSGTRLPTSSPAGLGPWPSSAVCGGWMSIWRLFGCCIFYIPISHLRLGLLHRRWTLLLGAPLLALSLCVACWPSLQRPRGIHSLPRVLWDGLLQLVHSQFVLGGRGRRDHGVGGERSSDIGMCGWAFLMHSSRLVGSAVKEWERQHWYTDWQTQKNTCYSTTVVQWITGWCIRIW